MFLYPPTPGGYLDRRRIERSHSTPAVEVGGIRLSRKPISVRSSVRRFRAEKFQQNPAKHSNKSKGVG